MKILSYKRKGVIFIAEIKCRFGKTKTYVGRFYSNHEKSCWPEIMSLYCQGGEIADRKTERAIQAHIIKLNFEKIKEIQE